MPLLRASCVREALQTMAIVLSKSSAFGSHAKMNMGSDRLSQRFGVRGRFLNEPEVRHITYGLNLLPILQGLENNLGMI